MMGWLQHRNTPPLVTTGPAVPKEDAGVIGAEGTRVLFGGPLDEGLQPAGFGTCHFSAERCQAEEPTRRRATLGRRWLRGRRPIALFDEAIDDHTVECAIQVAR